MLLSTTYSTFKYCRATSSEQPSILIMCRSGILNTSTWQPHSTHAVLGTWWRSHPYITFCNPILFGLHFHCGFLYFSEQYSLCVNTIQWLRRTKSKVPGFRDKRTISGFLRWCHSGALILCAWTCFPMTWKPAALYRAFLPFPVVKGHVTLRSFYLLLCFASTAPTVTALKNSQMACTNT